MQDCLPQDIYSYLNLHICGQEEAKKAAALLLWNHLNGRRQTLLLAGPTGCGKTEIWRSLAILYPQIRIVGASRLMMADGRETCRLADGFDGLTKQEAEQLLLGIDEADRLFEDASGNFHAETIRSELLRILDGGSVPVRGTDGKTHSISCENVSVVLCGVFPGLLGGAGRAYRPVGFRISDAVGTKEPETKYRGKPEELPRKTGISPEIAGRIQNVVILPALSEKELENILNKPDGSPVAALEEQYGVRIDLEEETKKALARQAAESGLGCRILTSRIRCMLDESVFANGLRERHVLRLE